MLSYEENINHIMIWTSLPDHNYTKKSDSNFFKTSKYLKLYKLLTILYRDKIINIISELFLKSTNYVFVIWSIKKIELKLGL